jgi:uncharacterized Zn-binding protein involved in type VI secretion
MSYKRYYILAGATTTANGVVRVTSDFSLAGGAALARDGDPVDCPACGRQGFIRCTGPRLSDSFEGREYALSDDLCICSCDPAPQLIADRREDFQLVVQPAGARSVAS